MRPEVACGMIECSLMLFYFCCHNLKPVHDIGHTSSRSRHNSLQTVFVLFGTHDAEIVGVQPFLPERI